LFIGFDSSSGITLPSQLDGSAGGIAADHAVDPSLQSLPVFVIGRGAALAGYSPVWRTLTSEYGLAVLDDLSRRTAHIVLQVPVRFAPSLSPDTFVLLFTHLHETLLNLHVLDVLAGGRVLFAGAHQGVLSLGPRGIAADGISGLAPHHPGVGVLGVTVVLRPHDLTLADAEEA